MSLRKIAIVVTTIYEPVFIEGYLQNLKKYEREKEVRIIIIPDKKTPPSVSQVSLNAKVRGFDVVCPSLEKQESFLAALGLPGGFIPYNTDNRRNIGFLMALEWGCDVLISIDDDNFCLPDIDFVGEHLCVGNSFDGKVVKTSDGWFNICSMLESNLPIPIYPRGFPYSARSIDRQISMTDMGSSRKPVAINAGLWLDDPDVDALSRLSLNPKTLSSKSESVILGDTVWSPINTQNTALTREAAMAYYYVRMGYPLTGMKIDRYGDILSGYFIQKCVKHLGQCIRVGSPVANHHRTQHNIFKDLYNELAGIVICEELVPWLKEVKLEGQTYLDAYECLANQLIQAADRFKGFIWDEGGKDFLRETGSLMLLWNKTGRRFS
jgi:hypothetical protein